jgi:hypothetical protein
MNDEKITRHYITLHCIALHTSHYYITSTEIFDDLDPVLSFVPDSHARVAGPQINPED